MKMSENRFKKGDWTNCRYDICEIIDEDDEVVCIVSLNDADKVIAILEENEQLKQEHKIAIDEMITDYKNLEKENEQLKMLNSACKNGQKNLMKEMEKNEEALDKIWEIIKKLYGVIDDE